MPRMISASINGRGGFDPPVNATDDAETYDEDGTCFSRKSTSATRVLDSEEDVRPFGPHFKFGLR